MDDGIRVAVETATGRRVRRSIVVRGGDTAAAFRVDLDDGSALFAKTHPSPPAGFFTTEAHGLAWLAEAGALLVPTVIGASDDAPAHLLLGWVEEGRPVPTTEADLGRGLAALHRTGAPCFGREDRRTTGSLGLPNEPAERWATHVAANRLLPLARIARDRRALPAATIARLERLAGRLANWDDEEPPSRLHGDLWAGNRLVDRDGRNWLIDPAAHGGHREFDLAMMHLFGGFAPACTTAYDEVHPLRTGWQDRVQLHQIPPLVVHAIKFGGGYVAAATAAIDRYA